MGELDTAFLDRAFNNPVMSTASRNHIDTMNSQMNMSDMQYAALNSRTSQSMQNTLARVYSGSGGNTPVNIAGLLASGSTTDQNMAKAIGVGVAGMESRGFLGGGSSTNMMYGITQAIQSGGFTVGGETIYGGGAISSAMSRRMFDSVSAQFENTSGGMRADRAYGLNKSDLGELFSVMGQRGAFRGIEAGTIQTVTPAMIADATAKGDTALAEELNQIGEGGTRVQFNENAAKKVTDYMSDAAKSIKNLRGVFGDKSVQELVGEAERITGMTFGGPDDLGNLEINKRLGQTQQAARLLNINERSMMEFNYMTSQTMAAVMAQATGSSVADNMKFSSAVSYIADNNAIDTFEAESANAAALRSKGIHIKTSSREAHAAMAAEGISRILAENPEMAELAYIAQNNKSLTDEQRAEIETLNQGVATAVTQEERAAARKNISSAIERFTGQAAGTLTRGVGGIDNILGALSPENAQAIAGIASQADQSYMVNDFVSVAKLQNTKGLASEDMGKLMYNLSSKFDAGTVRDISELLGTDGGMAKLKEQLLDPEGLGKYAGKTPEERASLIASLEAAQAGVGGEKALGEAMSQFGFNMATKGSTLTMQSAQGRAEMDARRVNDFKKQNVYGNSPANNTDIIEQFMMGLNGSVTITDSMILDAAATDEKMKGKLVKLTSNVDGGYNIDEKQVGALATMLKESGGGDLKKALGLEDTDTDAAVAEVLQTEAGAALLATALMGSNVAAGYSFTETATGKSQVSSLTLLGRDDKNTTADNIAALAEKRLQLILEGRSDKEIEEQMKGAAAEFASDKATFTSKTEEAKTAAIATLDREDLLRMGAKDGSSASKALSVISGTHTQALMDKLNVEESSIDAEIKSAGADSERGKELQKQKSVIAGMKADLGNKDNKYLGVLQLVAQAGLQIALSKVGGAEQTT